MLEKSLTQPSLRSATLSPLLGEGGRAHLAMVKHEAQTWTISSLVGRGWPSGAEAG